MSVYDGTSVARIVTSTTPVHQSTPTRMVHSIHARRERANRRTAADAVTDPNISSAGIRLLLLIQRAGGVLYRTQDAIAETLKVSRMTVYRVARYLERAGYLLIRRGRPNGYTLNDGRTPEDGQP